MKPIQVSCVIPEVHKAILLFSGHPHRLNILDKALVHVLLVGDGTIEHAGLNGEMPEILELRSHDA